MARIIILDCFIVFALYSIIVQCFGDEFCSVDNFDNIGNHMQFTKEANFEEYAVTGTFKDLHCCAKGYRSIIWLKDGKVYPWSLQISSFILFPESANQTIYAKGLKQEDAGNYTCVLRNETVVHSHTIQLSIFDKVPDDAKITYITPDREVAVGDNLRLFCEAFIGQVDLPDARSETYWRKISSNDTLEDLPAHFEEKKIRREDNQTFGVYLYVKSMRSEDFGQYACIINKPGNDISYYVNITEKGEAIFEVDSNEDSVGQVILLLSIVFVFLMTILVIFSKFGLQLLVHLRDSTFCHRCNVDDDMDKMYDILMVYAQQDSELVLGVLAHTLEEYKYTCLAKCLPETFGTWDTVLREESKKCRRIIAVLSPPLLNGCWDSNSILQAIKLLQLYDTKLVCLTLKCLPKSQCEVKNAQGEMLSNIIKSIPILEWKRQQNDDKFWYALRWRLPTASRRAEEARLKKQSQLDDNNIMIV